MLALAYDSSPMAGTTVSRITARVRKIIFSDQLVLTRPAFTAASACEAGRQDGDWSRLLRLHLTQFPPPPQSGAVRGRPVIHRQEKMVTHGADGAQQVDKLWVFSEFKGAPRADARDKDRRRLGLFNP